MNATTYNNPIAQAGTNANNNAAAYATGSNSNPNLLGVRDTLSKQFGIDNNRIGYNANNGNVQVDGQDVFKPSQNIGGTTYATQDEFNSIGGKLNALNNQYKLQQQATNPTGLNPYQSQVGDLLTQLKSMQTQGAPTMQDVYNSPQYAAAKAQQQLAAQQGINAAQEALGASGMARSSDLANDAQNVQNRANLYLETQAAPTILAALQNQRQQQYSNVENLLNSLSSMNSQANQTALGQQNAAINLLNQLNQQRNAQAGLTGYLDGQRTLAGENTDLQREEALYNQGRLTQQDHINLANQLQQAYGVPVEPKDDPALMYEQVKGLTPLNAQQLQSTINLQKAQGNYYNDHGAYYDSRQGYPGYGGNGIGNPNQRISQLMDVWKNTGKAPDGLQGLGVEPGTPYGNSNQTPKIDPKESANNFMQAQSYIDNDAAYKKMSKDQKTAYLKSLSPYLTDSDYKELLKNNGG